MPVRYRSPPLPCESSNQRRLPGLVCESYTHPGPSRRSPRIRPCEHVPTCQSDGGLPLIFRGVEVHTGPTTVPRSVCRLGELSVGRCLAGRSPRGPWTAPSCERVLGDGRGHTGTPLHTTRVSGGTVLEYELLREGHLSLGVDDDDLSIPGSPCSPVEVRPPSGPLSAANPRGDVWDCALHTLYLP